MTRKIPATILFAGMLAGLALTVISTLPSSAQDAAAEPDYIYLGVYDNDAPFVDYEGSGMVVASSTRQSDPQGPYEVELLVVELDPTREAYVLGDDVEDRLVLRLEGKIRRRGKNGLRMRGKLETRGPARIQLVQMTRKGDPSGETFPEIDFATGTHDVRVDAKIAGWLER